MRDTEAEDAADKDFFDRAKLPICITSHPVIA